MPRDALSGCTRLESIKLCHIRCPDGLACRSLRRINFVEHLNLSMSHDMLLQTLSRLRQTLSACLTRGGTALTSVRIYFIEDCIHSTMGTVAMVQISSRLSLPDGWLLKVCLVLTWPFLAA